MCVTRLTEIYTIILQEYTIVHNRDTVNRTLTKNIDTLLSTFQDEDHGQL